MTGWTTCHSKPFFLIGPTCSEFSFLYLCFCRYHEISGHPRLNSVIQDDVLLSHKRMLQSRDRMFSMRWGDIIIDINMAFFQLLETSNFHDTVLENDENKKN